MCVGRVKGFRGVVKWQLLWQSGPYSETVKRTGCKLYFTRTYLHSHANVCMHMYVNRFNCIILILYKPLIWICYDKPLTTQMFCCLCVRALYFSELILTRPFGTQHILCFFSRCEYKMDPLGQIFTRREHLFTFLCLFLHFSETVGECKNRKFDLCQLI